MTVVSDTGLELIRLEDAAAIVHYDIPSVKNRFASRLLTMKSFFSHQCLQNRVLILCYRMIKLFTFVTRHRVSTSMY